MNAEARVNILEEEKRRLEETRQLLEHENISLREETGSLQSENKYLNEQVEDLRRRLYGRRSERVDPPGQLYFFKELFEDGQPGEEKEERQKIEYERKQPRKRGPKPLPDNLPRDVVTLDPGEGDRTCACCREPMERHDEIVSEELTVKPPEFRVTQYVRGKWRCPSCMNRSITAPLPPRPIERGRPSPTLLAYIVVSKWVDHLPLYRQEEIFKRYGLELSRKTMDGWLDLLADLLRPVVEAMKDWLLEKNFLQSDDTPLRYLDPAVKGKSRRGYLWSWGIPAGEIVYRFTESRSHKHPLAFLEGFSGYLQTDGLEVYKAVYNSGRVEHIACMAHIRRKFFEAKGAAPERVEEILSLIRTLYRVEEEAREGGIRGEALLELRRRKSRPVMEKLRGRIGKLEPLTTPKLKLGKAVRYARRQWRSMERYLDVAEAEIDNNWCENSLRPVVLSRKNFLFLGSAGGGGKRAEVFFSLTQSAKRLGLDPFSYLTDIIDRVSTHPAARVWELTPRGYKEAGVRAEKLTARTAR